MISKEVALLLIDTQVNMFDPARPVHSAEPLLVRLNVLVAKARAAGVPIVFVRNCGGIGDPDERGTEGWELQPDLGVSAGTEWDGFTVHPRSFHDVGDSAIVEGRYSGTYKSTGKSMDVQMCRAQET